MSRSVPGTHWAALRSSTVANATIRIVTIRARAVAALVDQRRVRTTDDFRSFEAREREQTATPTTTFLRIRSILIHLLSIASAR